MKLLSAREASQAHFDTVTYWRQRYLRGGTAGKGTYGRLGAFKAETINGFFKEQRIASAIEFGCGEGDQAALFNIFRYTGLDVSDTAIARAKAKFNDRTGWQFLTVQEAPLAELRAETSLSLDVIYHLIEDDLYERYMRQLFAAAEQFVVIYSSNQRDRGSRSAHVRHRVFTDWIAANAKDWMLLRRIPNRFPRRPWARRDRSFCDFYIYQRCAS
jgi:SAM-dependent methyltransferase